MAKKRTSEQVQKAVKKAEKEIASGEPITATLKKHKISSNMWAKYRGQAKSKPKQNKVTVTEIQAPQMSGKTILLISDDRDLIQSVINDFTRS